MAGSSVPQQDTATETVATVLLDGSQTLVPVEAGVTILEAARRSGLNPPFACEEGNCGTCMARLVDGRVEMRVNDALTDEDVADGYILTCQSDPLTPTLTVEYE
ncbi:2Fe-2S iron-sulfur cluster-binding protein [Nocardia bovistercoris]|uniref:2Fe-2S iron-sulfur cluster binding domain-containing protein n=1 Tax=Nocardia bovistercoris TaxID=2785916 RepID=A0A931II33_9NOCA|nr:2Fe-2S iron-sulfur cluster-binding protein [Nocardia bovistercoris]MBH0780766.1 2Fe-2S iron-sulfur cluster binding domain-containing protein [Nocardia bovistercoris]